MDRGPVPAPAPRMAIDDETPALPPSRRDARGLLGGRDRAAAGAAALGDALAHGVGTYSRVPRGPLPRRAAGSAPTWGFRRSPPSPVHARVARGGHRRVLDRGPRAATAARRTRHRRGDPAVGGPHGSHQPRAARANAEPPALQAAAGGDPDGVEGGGPGGLDPGRRPDAHARRQARVLARPRAPALGPRQRAGGGPDATRLRRCPRQFRAGALVGQMGSPLAAGRPGRTARDVRAPADAGVAAVGRPRSVASAGSGGRGGLGAPAARPAARAAEHGLPDGVRRSRRLGARAGRLLRMSSARGDRG